MRSGDRSPWSKSHQLNEACRSIGGLLFLYHVQLYQAGSANCGCRQHNTEGNAYPTTTSQQPSFHTHVHNLNALKHLSLRFPDADTIEM
ncbi:hypothetical protein SAMN06265222_12191 [Neorhodopirellula lusitana]|uniref:Uncharacterized protein n=1 Tax=Neorhodopirellula lusitana TaxID=445327 RepID=A0ABY1QNZ8_9BACT|nr:hypothetical protein SAMN06265222_12191 [Neorhodopirellula lusitana]